MKQLVLNIEQPSILPVLRKLVALIDGVSIAIPARKARTAAKDEWLSEEVRQSIARGEADIANGRAKKMTASEIRTMLGV